MRIWIVCTGEREGIWPKRCDAGTFTACARRAAEEEPEERQERKLNAAGETVLIAPTPAARRTAALCTEGGTLREEPLLSPVLQTAEGGTGEHALWFWQWRAARQRRAGDKRQSESRKQIAARAEQLFTRLEAEEKDCILVADWLLTEELLDRARRHGCTQTRTGIFRYRPWERVLITRRDMHCGGCGHNCLLSNPGCGIGRDKAARKSG